MKTLRGSFRELLILFTGFILVGLVDYVFYRWPLSTLLEEKRQAVEKHGLLLQKNRIFSLEVIEARKKYEFFRNDFNTRKAEIDKIIGQFYYLNDKGALVDNIQKYFKMAEVRLFKIDFQAIESKELYSRFPFTAEWEGPYSAIKEIFYRLEYQVKGLTIENLEFLELNNDQRKIKMRMTASIKLHPGAPPGS